MKKLLVGSISLACIVAASAAFAADMPLKAVKAPPAMAVDPWNGFYIGINGGAGIGRNHTTYTTIVPDPFFPVFDFADLNHSPAGAIFGLQAGWNWHALPNLVLGVEADWQWSGQRETICTYACLPASSAGALLSITAEQSLQWFGTFRGRAGFLTQGGTLLYATGGLAWGRINQSQLLTAEPGFFLTGTTASASFNDDKIGWAAGAGVETPVWGNWSVKAEYLYIDLGTVTHSFSTPLDPFFIGPQTTTTSVSRINDHIVRVGLNYHFNERFGTGASAFAMAAPAPAATSWNGFYVGANAGMGLARNPTLDTFRIGPAAFVSFPDFGDDAYHQMPFGGLVGAQIGYNWRFAPNWLIGAEADWQWSHQTGIACISECLPAAVSGVPFILPGILQGQTDSQTIKDFGTARLRLGWIAPGGSLWYVTGGAAWARIEDSISAFATPGVFAGPTIAGLTEISASFKHTKFGWTVGAGAELPLWDRWSLKGEYLFVDLGSVNDSFTSPLDSVQLPAQTITTATSFHIYDHIARLGLNYHFN